ncbi:hypothetical protein [uncultured Parasutterella sp.]|uniref:hypothetical protein n=2 Tax=uncultured Parasutterella sp. TaxID=1263098 RepID=UPI0025A6869D|nr:hypothetical protein [uncultured Parasutterella sp.]
MITNFQLDTKAAARADSQTPNIRRSGAFAGQITAARTYITRSGAQMLEIIFVAHEGKANINLCLFKKDGSENFGRDMFMSMLTCLRLKNVNAVKSTIKDRNGNDQEAYLFPDLAGREIGLLLQYAPEEYQASDGTIRVADRVNLVTSFEPSTGLVAKEILERVTKPELLEIRKEHVIDKPLKKLSVSDNEFENPPVKKTAKQPLDNMDDDDIPF